MQQRCGNNVENPEPSPSWLPCAHFCQLNCPVTGSFYIRTAVACSNQQESASRTLEYHLPFSITPALERPRAISDQEPSEDSQPSTSGRCHNRPASHGRITPSRLASLSEILGMPLPMLQRLLEVSPVLLSVEPPHLQQQLQRQAEELGLPVKAIVHMVCHQPGLMVRAKEGQLQAAVEALAAELGLGSDKVVRWVAVTPSVMRHHPKVVRRRLEKLAALVGLKGLAPAVRLVAAAPQYITDSYGSIERRLAEMSQVLRRPLRQVQNMVAREPKLPFLGTRIFTNRLKILQAILQKQYRHIVTLAVKCPALVVSDMETARQVYHGLGKLLGMEQGVVYAMVCHCPELLRVSLARLAQRQRRLARVLQVFPAWESQWKALNPALRADCLMCTATTYHRLEFLLLAQQAASVSLVDALRMARVDFSRRWPGFEVAMERAAARKLAERLTTGQHEHQPVHRLRVGRSSKLGRAGLSLQGSWQHDGTSSRRTGNGDGWGWGEGVHDARSHRQGSSEWRQHHGAASASALHARLAESVDRTKREVKRRRRRVEQAQQQERELSWRHQVWQQQQQQEAPDNLDEEQPQGTTQDGVPSTQGSGGEAIMAAALSQQHDSDKPMQWQQLRDQPSSERHCSMADTPVACGAASSAHASSSAAQAAADDSHASSLNGAAFSSSSLNGAQSHQQMPPPQHAPSGHANGFSSDDSSHTSSNGYHSLELHNLDGYVQLAPNRTWGHASDVNSSALAVSAVMGSSGMEVGQQATQLTARAHYMDHICSTSSSTGLEGEGSSTSSTGHTDSGAHSAGVIRGNGSSSSIGKAEHGFEVGGSSRNRNGKGKERRVASRQQNELASAVPAGVVMAHSKHGPA